jgi:D-alanine-D-alanine ligase
MRKNIAIVFGGDSSESVISVKTAEVVYQQLKTAEKFEVCKVWISREKWVAHDGGKEYSIDKSDFSYYREGEKVKFDGAFIAIHGTPGENGKLQGYFDLIDVPYTTAGQFEMALTFEKAYCNHLLKEMGFRTPPGEFFRINRPYDIDKLAEKYGFPCFIKPSKAGSSFGITKVKNKSDLPDAIVNAGEHDDVIIIEKAINGREITCGVYNFEGETKALPLTEIIPYSEFFDFKAKYEGNSKEVTPAEIDPAIESNIQDTAKKVFEALNLNVLARVDFIVEDQKPYIIEINTVPGMTEESLVPQQARAAGYSLHGFFSGMVEYILQSR